jgi:inosine-uridine nucleoside N-ribohydrolase
VPELRRSARTVTLGVALGLIAGACGQAAPSAPVVTGEPPTARIPVVIDTDLDLSDLAAIAILLRDPKLDVRAITISGTGIVHCKGGRRLARYVLDEFGAPDLPLGCGREDPGKDGHPFPAEWRTAADAGFGLDIPASVETGASRTAVQVLSAAVAESPSAPTVVTLGPLTDLEDAFAADATLADRVAGIHAMLGAVDAPGNVLVDDHTADDHLEWNAFADPSAVKAVLDADVPMSMVPLDATDDVPVPTDLAERLAAGKAAAGSDLVRELLIRNPTRLQPDQGQQLWDELAALTLTNPDLAEWTETTLIAGTDGRLTQDDAGRSVRVAQHADRTAVEAALLDALGRGSARATPFQLAGELSVAFDGSHCVLSGHSDRDGPHSVTFKGPKGKPSGVGIVGATEPHTWKDVLALLPTFKVDQPQPEWLVVGPSALDATGAGVEAMATGDLAEGFYGPICFRGDAPQLALTAGTPFEVGSGQIGS